MTNKEIVQGFFIEAYQNHNYNFVMEHFAEDYIDHSPAGARSNKDAIEILKIVAEMFGELKIELLDLFEEDGMVGTRIRFQGVHIGDCMGVLPTGKNITFEALENFKVMDGKVTESWGYWPDMEILNKLQAKE